MVLYRTASRSLKRVRHLASSLDRSHGHTRRAVVDSVDRLLNLQGWKTEDSIKVRDEACPACSVIPTVRLGASLACAGWWGAAERTASNRQD